MPSADRILCLACGASASPNSRFCGQCGAALSQVCPACHSTNPANNRFCGDCGAPLPPAAKQATAAPTTPATEIDAARRWVTVLFADISGFTAMSERMDSEDVKNFADQCSQRMGQEVRRFGGTVVQVIGDQVYAVFGAPVAH